MPIRKAVIPAAGFGTRFLPYTKAVPKEMLPVLDKPVIHHVVEEAVAAGIREILIVTSRGKTAIEDYFDRHHELESHLLARGDLAAVERLRELSELAGIYTVRQKQIRGLGDAVAAAESFVGREPFAVLLGDMLIDGPVPALSQMVEAFDNSQQSVVGLTSVPADVTHRYGIATGRAIGGKVVQVEELVEKPPAGTATSNLAMAGRYIFTSDIFSCISRTALGHKGELQLTDAMDLLRAERGLQGVTIEGDTYDVGDKLGFLRATIAYAQRAGLGEALLDPASSVNG